MASNYPFVFSAYGIAGITGPILGGFVRDNTGTFLMAFIPAGIACIIGSFLALTIKLPSERRSEDRRTVERRKVEAVKEIPEDENRMDGRRREEGRRIEKGVSWPTGTHGRITGITEQADEA